ncbi:MAG: Cys-tRNA(Pro) deacylase [Gammaproteobacteria bacterium]|nr:Cys-tRNA(Pro) deacylase [Gammaproteobacteria bacterium]
MTPAVESARAEMIDFDIHEYDHDAAVDNYGLEAAEAMGVPAGQVFKTLVVEGDSGAFAVGMVPVDAQLSLKAMAKAVGFKKAKMAGGADVERVTGYVLGGVSPLGQKRRLPTVIDESVSRFDRIYVSAGKRGLEISLAPGDLQRLTAATRVAIASS